MNARRLVAVLPFVFLLAVAAGVLPGDARAGFLLPPTTLQGSPVESQAYFGFAVAVKITGGDGFDHLLVSAPYRDVSGHANSGEVYVLNGPSLSAGPVLHHPILEDEARFGYSLATGDMNGDGLADAIIGSPYAGVGAYSTAGAVYVALGPSLSSVVAVPNPVPESGAHFGFAVAAADVNEDGKDDLLVGAPDATDAGQNRAGKAYVLLAPAFSTVSALHDPEPDYQAYFGRALSGGDIDGDGDDDVIVGAPESNMGPQKEILDAGQAFVFGAPLLVLAKQLQDPEPQGGAFFGRSVAVGDFDNDNDGDVMVGAYGSDIWPHATAGQVFVIGAPTLVDITTLVEPVAELDACFGFALTAADVNGDGYDDAVIGTHDADVGDFVYTSGGEAYVFYGPSLSAVVRLQDPVLEDFAFFARAVAVGDINDDGRGDLVAGGPWSNVGGVADAGEALVFLAEPDADGDGLADPADNCPLAFNPGQLNSDALPLDNGAAIPGDDATVPAADGQGDACDPDDDNDGLPDAQESDSACPFCLVRDSDGDGSLDGYERSRGFDPCSAANKPPVGSTAHSDGDGLVDDIEVRGRGTDPYAIDSDGDGCDDDKEVASVNADKQANILDVLWVSKAAFGIIPCHPGLDLNRNAACDILDAALAARNSSLVESSPVCP